MSFSEKEAGEIYESLKVKSKQETVVRMYVQKFDNETIAKVTTLSIAQIKEQIIHIKSGELIKSFEIASKMIVEGLQLEQVATLTGLQKSVVEELRKEMIEKGDISI